MNYYTGVGARKTPSHVLRLMGRIACVMALKGWTLRTGDADGADRAFREGALATAGRSLVEIYTANDIDQMDGPAMMVAAEYHGAWHRMSVYAQKLHGRNVYQVLGPGMDSPSKGLICWTPDGVTVHAKRTIATGGTGTAISIASEHDVPVHNLANEESYHMWEEWADEQRTKEMGQ